MRIRVYCMLAVLAGSLSSVAAHAQSPAPEVPEGSVPLQTQNNVSNSVTVDSVLLPYKVARRTFGGEIADSYAVVQITISNHNSDSALIVHSALLDESRWLFSGTLTGYTSLSPAPITTYQQENTASQVASAESRVVRGEALDKQPWTFRNVAIRAAVTLGTLASGFEFFAGGNTQVLSGISAYNGQAIPAFQLFWPDNTQAKLNRISDFGFQTNKVVPKSSSDIIIAFFPLDRFLTHALKTLYKKDPAAFFNPLEMLLDPKYEKSFLPLFHGVADIGPADDNARIKQRLLLAFDHYNSATEEQKRGHRGPIDANDDKLLRIISSVSLNNIRVIVGGVLTVDRLSVPPVISSVTLEDDLTVRSKKAAHKAAIDGTFLDGGDVVFFDESGKPFTPAMTVAIDRKRSTDRHLEFTYQPADDLALPDTMAFVKVTKTGGDGASAISAPFRVDLNPSLTVNADPTLTSPANASKAAAWASTSGPIALAFTLTGRGLTGSTAACSVDRGSITTGKVTVKNDNELAVACMATSNLSSGSGIKITVSSVAKDGSTVTAATTYTIKYE